MAVQNMLRSHLPQTFSLAHSSFLWGQVCKMLAWLSLCTTSGCIVLLMNLCGRGKLPAFMLGNLCLLAAVLSHSKLAEVTVLSISILLNACLARCRSQRAIQERQERYRRAMEAPSMAWMP